MLGTGLGPCLVSHAEAADCHLVPLTAACRAGKLAEAHLLLAAGASPNQPKPEVSATAGNLREGETPLIAAVRAGWREGGEARLANLRLLLESGGAPNYVLRGNANRTSADSQGAALHFAILEWWPEYWKDVRRSRKQREVDANTLRLAEVNNTFVERAVRMLLDAGGDPNLARPGDGQTPLHLAANVGSLPLTKLLLERGADVRIKDRSGFTALSGAVVWGDNPELLSFYEDYLDARQIAIDDPRWRNRGMDSFAEGLTGALRFMAYLSLPLAYTAGAVYAREGYYGDHPRDNWLGVGHAYLMVVGSSVVATGLLGGLLAVGKSSGWKAVGRGALGFLVGAVVVGLPAGILATYYGRMPQHFNDYRALYYLPPACALVATTVALTVEF